MSFASYYIAYTVLVFIYVLDGGYKKMNMAICLSFTKYKLVFLSWNWVFLINFAWDIVNLNFQNNIYSYKIIGYSYMSASDFELTDKNP